MRTSPDRKLTTTYQMPEAQPIFGTSGLPLMVHVSTSHQQQPQYSKGSIRRFGHDVWPTTASTAGTTE